MGTWIEEYSGFYPKEIVEPSVMQGEEKVFYDAFISSLSNSLDFEDIVVEQRDGDYRTVVYKDWDNDFLRYNLDFEDPWVSVRMYSPLMKKYKDNPLFDAQENKRQLHWRSSIDPLDIGLLHDVIVESCEIFLENNME